MPDATASPHHLLALDADALAGAEVGGYRRLADRISDVRAELVLVLIGDSQIGGMPEPDYVVDPGTAAITRLPGGVHVAGWPPEDTVPDLGSTIAHLAAELLISPSEAFVVVGAERLPVGTVQNLIVLGGDSAPPDGLWIDDSGEDRLIDALQQARLLGRWIASAADVCDIAFDAAVEVVRRNTTVLGFTAATPGRNLLRAHDANYAAVWARDAVITGLWTLCLDDEELTACFERSLRTLARHQTPMGQIPTNVRLDGTPDYSGIGGIAGIDAVLWWVIGVARLSLHAGDRQLAEDLVDPVERAMGWLASHDSNNNGLLEIPESSDWMDLFPRSYNVLYDEVLWYEACLHAATLLEALGRDGSVWSDCAERVRRHIVTRFWPTGEQLMEIAGSTSGQFGVGEAQYLLSQITPFDYGWRCDVYANLLAALSGLLDEHRSTRLFNFLWGVGVNIPYPVTSLYPPIQSGADDWKDYFLVNFLNLPGHYHNGGIWPFIGGLWVRYLVSISRIELAHRELVGLAEACRQGIDEEWEFNEWLHGQTGRPMGKAEQAWSAASYVHAYLSLYGDVPAEVFPPLKPGF